MSTRTILRLMDKKNLLDFIKWTVDNETPCTACNADHASCCGCDKQTAYETEKQEKFKKVSYLYPDCEPLASAYETYYKALKVKRAATKAKNEADEKAEDALRSYIEICIKDYAVYNNTNVFHQGDFMDEVPKTINGRTDWYPIDIPERFTNTGYHMLYCKYSTAYSNESYGPGYFIYKETLPTDTNCPFRYRFIGYTANRKEIMHHLTYDYYHVMKYEECESKKTEEQNNGTK